MSNKEPEKEPDHSPSPMHQIRLLEAELARKENEIRELRKHVESNRQETKNIKAYTENSKKLNLVLQASQIGVWEWDIATNKLHWDARSKAIFGYTDKEFDGNLATFIQCLHPEDVERVQHTIKESAEKNIPYSIEYRAVWDDQSIHHIIAHGLTVYNENGAPVKMLGTNLDITEIQRKDEKIRRVGKLLEESYSEVFIFDARTYKFLDVNLGLRTNLGYTLEELLEMTPLDLRPEYTLEAFQQATAPLLDDSKEKVTFETSHVRKDGSTYHVLVNLQLSTYNGRKVFIATTQDITALVQVQEQLSASEERLELALQGTSDGVWDWPDIYANKTWWSSKFYELLGMQHEEIEATRDNFFWLVHPEDKDVIHKQLQLHIKEGQPFDVEFRLRHKTKGYLWYRSRAQVLRNKKGNPLRMSGAITDIHSRKQAEFQLTHTNMKLKKANEYLDNFVFTVAHDLRSPVANLKSLVELFKLQANTEDPIVDRIDLSVERLEKTLRGLVQILDVQKMEKKSGTPVSFQEILDKLLEKMEDDINRQHVVLQTDFAVKEINYIRSFLENIISTLLSNAIRYQRAEEPPRIFIRSGKYKEFVLLEVADNGTGIDLNRFKDKLFKPFEKLTKNSSGQGTGLHLVKTMVEKNGGKVKVNSKLKEGTTFQVYLKPY